MGDKSKEGLLILLGLVLVAVALAFIVFGAEGDFFPLAIIFAAGLGDFLNAVLLDSPVDLLLLLDVAEEVYKNEKWKYSFHEIMENVRCNLGWCLIPEQTKKHVDVVPRNC